jgi:hypothetical protein
VLIGAQARHLGAAVEGAQVHPLGKRDRAALGDCFCRPCVLASYLDDDQEAEADAGMLGL